MRFTWNLSLLNLRNMNLDLRYIDNALSMYKLNILYLNMYFVSSWTEDSCLLIFFQRISTCHVKRSCQRRCGCGRAMALCNSRTRAHCPCRMCEWGQMNIFLSFIFSFFFILFSLQKTALYSLKSCLEDPFKPKTTNHLTIVEEALLIFLAHILSRACMKK